MLTQPPWHPPGSQGFCAVGTALGTSVVTGASHLRVLSEDLRREAFRVCVECFQIHTFPGVPRFRFRVLHIPYLGRISGEASLDARSCLMSPEKNVPLCASLIIAALGMHTFLLNLTAVSGDEAFACDEPGTARNRRKAPQVPSAPGRNTRSHSGSGQTAA